jgi:hypothetical protein
MLYSAKTGPNRRILFVKQRFRQKSIGITAGRNVNLLVSGYNVMNSPAKFITIVNKS